MEKLRLGAFSLVLALIVVAGNTPSLFAQEGAAFTLEEVTVTAQKREENLQKTPITMETISGHNLTEMGKTSLDDILTNIAGAWIQGSGVQLNVVMRGMDNDEGARSSFSMTAINVDGVYSNNRETGSVGTYDLQRVEVLVGPQGTLYSRNASAGVINFLTNNPNRDQFEGSGTLKLGNYDQLTMTGVMNAPLHDKAALRVAFNANSHEGYASNGTMDNDTKEARIKLGYYPLEELSMVLTYEFIKMHGHGKTGFEPFEDEDDTSNPWTVLSPLEQWRVHRHTDKANLNLNWTTPVGTLTFLPSIMVQKAPQDQQSMAQRDPVTGETIYQLNYQDQDTKERSGELRIASNEGSSWQYLLGAYYYFRGTYQTRSGAMSMYGEQENENYSAFGNVTYSLSDDIRVTVGGRYTDDSEYFLDIVPEGMLRPGQEPISEEEYSSDNFDYKLAIEYDASEHSMIWADYSTGYKHTLRGGEPQELITYQLGAKNRFLNERLQLNATAFYNDYSNYSVVTTKAYWAEDGDGILTEYDDTGRGSGSAITYGLDLSTNYLPTSRDRIDIQASFLETEIDDLRIVYDYWYEPTDEFEGLELNNAPELTVTASYQHTFDLWNGGNLRAKINTRYQTETQLTFFLDENDVPQGMDPDKINHEPAHTISEIGLTYNDPSNRWNLNAYVKNIENHARKFSFDGRMGMMVGDPRTYGAVLTIKF